MAALIDDSQGKKFCLFAIPKKGRLKEKCDELLRGAGIKYHRPDRTDVATVEGLPLKLVFLPAADIATYVGEGNVDMGITGEDVVAETDIEVVTKMKLGFGKCKLALQVRTRPLARSRSALAPAHPLSSPLLPSRAGPGRGRAHDGGQPCGEADRDVVPGAGAEVLRRCGEGGRPLRPADVDQVRVGVGRGGPVARAR